MTDDTRALVIFCLASMTIGFLLASWAYERMMRLERDKRAAADLSDLDAAISPADIPGCA